jgi:hypothetical protein
VVVLLNIEGESIFYLFFLFDNIKLVMVVLNIESWGESIFYLFFLFDNIKLVITLMNRNTSFRNTFEHKTLDI